MRPLVGGNPFLTALLYEYPAAKHMYGLIYANSYTTLPLNVYKYFLGLSVFVYILWFSKRD